MKKKFQFGEWLVHPAGNCIENANEQRQMEPRAMDVLLVLCRAEGGIVSAEELMSQCWGNAVYGDNPVHKSITQLRRLLGDNATSPVYIETIRKRGYRTLATVSALSAEPARAPNWLASSPFRGLAAFDETHAAVFFGREGATRRLADAVRAQAKSGLALALVLGPSGSGKTSLVQAGLFPSLSPARAGEGIALLATATFDLIDQGEQTLFTALAGAMLDMQWQDEPVFPGSSAVSLGQKLEQDTGAVIAEMQAVLAGQAELHAGLRFGLFIDRFEALFNASRVTEPERRAFLRTLEQLARSGAALVVIGCRNDFYPHVVQYPMLMEGKPNGSHFDLGPPSFSDIAQIIRLPTAAAGLRFGVDPKTNASLDDVLCESAAASPDSLPLLQYTLQELYQQRTEEGELSFEAYHRLGGVEGAIGQRAEQVVATFSDKQKETLSHIMSLIVVLSASDESVTGQRAPWSALRSDEERQVVAAFIESRLFVSDLMGDTPGFGVAHEAILRRWPRMTDWIDTHKTALRARGRLSQQAARWSSEGRSDDLLLPDGKLLLEAKGLQQSGLFALTVEEEQLISLSDKRVRWRDRLKLMVMLLMIVLTILATSLGLSALSAKRTAEQRRYEAEGLMDFMLGDFADKLRPLGKLDLLDSVSSKALEYLGNSKPEEMSATSLVQRAKALQVIAEVSNTRGDTKTAIDALDNAKLILMQQHAIAPRDPQVLKNLGANAYWVGQIRKDQNNWKAAADAMQKYLYFSNQLNQLEPNNIEWWLEQSFAHNNLGSFSLKQGDAKTAAKEFQLSIDLKERALLKNPDKPSMIADLADSYSWLATAKELLGELDFAEKFYAKEMDLVDRLRKLAPGEASWVRQQEAALQHRAKILEASGRDNDALRDYREAKVLLKAILAQDSKNRTWQGYVAYIEMEEQRLIALKENSVDTLPKLHEIQMALQELVNFNSKNTTWFRWNAVAHQRLAMALLAKQDIVNAQEELNVALRDLNKIYLNNVSNLQVRRSLIDALLLSSELAAAQNRTDDSQLACKKIYDMIKDDSIVSRNYQILDPWVRVNYCLRHRVEAKNAVQLLEKIGYRNSSYLHFITSH